VCRNYILYCSITPEPVAVKILNSKPFRSPTTPPPHFQPFKRRRGAATARAPWRRWISIQTRAASGTAVGRLG
jgi:hypothetical protein